MKVRIANGIVWAYLGMSSTLMPTNGGPNFAEEKLSQMTQLNPYLYSDFPRFLGTLVLPLMLWFLIDHRIRKTKNKNK